MNRLRCNIIGFVAISAIIGPWVSTTVAQDWYVSFFKEHKPLQLQTDRIAVMERQADGVTAMVATPAALTRVGIKQADITPSVIVRWSKATTPAGKRTALDTQDLVRTLAASGDLEFVSPVFLDERNLPLHLTPYVLVRFKEGVTAKQANAILAGSGVVVEVENFANISRVYRARCNSRDGFEVLAMTNQLAGRADVIFAEPDFIKTGVTSQFIPNDPIFPAQWALHNVGQDGGTADMDMDAPEAWDIALGNPSIITVVLDVGVQQDHPDLNLVPGFDATGQGTGGGPGNACDGHGTTVAGVITALIDNNRGTAGLAPLTKVGGARIGISNVPCDGTFSFSTSWLTSSLDWALTIGARVTNNSTSAGGSSINKTKYDETRDAGIVHLTSAGNGGFGQIFPPATYGSVLAVAALTRNGALASFSQFGDGLGFSAPGESIATADEIGAAGFGPGDTVTVNGTSYASPYAAAVAALILSVDSSLDARNVRQIMEETAVDLGDPGYDTVFGFGFLNALAAVQAVQAKFQPCELDRLTRNELAAFDDFGGSIDIEGEWIVLGASGDDDAASSSGAAYVYRRNGGVWDFQQKLVASDAAFADFFGKSVAVSGDWIIVGASGRDDNGSGSGTAYAYQWNGVIWVERHKIFPADAAAGDAFGAAVAMSGDGAVIGARLDDCANATSNCGGAYVFRLIGSTWTEEAKLVAPDALSGATFGNAVSMDGTVAAVGAVSTSCLVGGGACGATYMFSFDGANWDTGAKLTASDQVAGDGYGTSVAVSSGHVIMGGTGASCGLSFPSCGVAYLYEFDGANWTNEVRLAPNLQSASDLFGQSVAISGDLAIVGMNKDDCAGGVADCGSAVLFRRDVTTGVWSQDNLVGSTSPVAGARFGQSVAIEGTIAAVGASRDSCLNGTNCGAVYVVGLTEDCNQNGIVDVCDIFQGPSLDLDLDGRPDECTCIASSTPQTDTLGPKNRYLSVIAGDAGLNQAVRVTWTGAPAGHTDLIGLTMWIGAASDVSENSGFISAVGGFPDFKAATLQCTPFFADFSALGTIQVFHQNLIPGVTVSIQVMEETCLGLVDDFSAALVVTNSIWGDVVSDCSVLPCGPPNNSADLPFDTVAILDKFVNLATGPIKSRCDIDPEVPNRIIDISDVTRSVDAFGANPYPFATDAAVCP